MFSKFFEFVGENDIKDSSSIEEMITTEGLTFLEACYEKYLTVIVKDKYGIDFNGEELEKIYKKYREFENFYGVGRTRIWLPDPTKISEFFGKGRV